MADEILALELQKYFPARGPDTMSLKGFLGVLEEAHEHQSPLDRLHTLISEHGLPIIDQAGEPVPSSELAEKLQQADLEWFSEDVDGDWDYLKYLPEEKNYIVRRFDVSDAYRTAGCSTFPWARINTQTMEAELAWLDLEFHNSAKGFGVAASDDDFADALKQDSWTATEALCWLKGRVPDKSREHQLPKYYETEVAAIQKALPDKNGQGGVLTFDKSKPHEWIIWAESQGWILPQGLEYAMKQEFLDLKDLELEHDGLVRRLSTEKMPPSEEVVLESKIENLRKQIDFKRAHMAMLPKYHSEKIPPTCVSVINQQQESPNKRYPRAMGKYLTVAELRHRWGLDNNSYLDELASHEELVPCKNGETFHVREIGWGHEFGIPPDLSDYDTDLSAKTRVFDTSKITWVSTLPDDAVYSLPFILGYEEGNPQLKPAETKPEPAPASTVVDEVSADNWRNDQELTKGEKQRCAILTAIRLKKYDPMKIPTGGRGILKTICENDYPEIFDGDTSFENRWKLGRGIDWKMAHHASFAKRGK
ncbi:hypothetical protein [Methylococcus sp. EFPC2]|uniref:hypothetical protein n=1 Tax=Methylococcus sp. EFPC2 TaxID=2812648 RepID=UPI001967B344|nr:hypothetical protein [Methylococcus sp. EFPC2]QSA97727.1 hypothetical protein JWZ97_02525 [Methylococcus sp. EFPC2]